MENIFAIPAGAPHLGGYVPGGDEATYYPELWLALTEIARLQLNYPQDVRVLDVGAGDNVAVRYFQSLKGVQAIGVDGCETSDVLHDFTAAFLPQIGDFDLVWSCEFVEHVEERYLPFVLDALSRAPLLAMTYAAPGQPGHHHVNCQPEAYWVGALAGFGMRLDPALTALAKDRAGYNTSPWNHFAARGLVFKKND